MSRLTASLLLIASPGLAISPQSLVKAGVGGNPSFMVGVGFGANHRVAPIDKTCQGTLVARRGSRCTFVTAAHCLYGNSASPVPRFIHTPDFGVLTEFQVALRGDFVRREADDLAAVHFEQGCDARADKIVVPVGTLPPGPVNQEGLPIEAFAASAAYRRVFAGFLPAEYLPSRRLLSISLGSRLVVDGERQSEATYSGDSGGGLFLRDPRTSALSIVGVLSLGVYTGLNALAPPSQDQGASESVFVVDPDWIRRQAR